MKYVTGDLLAAPFSEVQAIGHGVNCMGVMGAGIAVAVRSKYGEEMYQEYKQSCNSAWLSIGNIHIWDRQLGLPVLFNLATQVWPGKDARYDAVQTAVDSMLVECIRRGISSVGLPRIGCGIGGLEWLFDEEKRNSCVKSILMEAEAKSTINITIYSLEQ